MMDLDIVAANLDVALARHSGGEKGRWYPGSRTISLRRGLGPVAYRCTLAHELGHAAHHHLAGDSLPDWVVQRQEREANEWAAQLLISEDDYARAEAVCPHPGAIARDLEVTVHLVEVWQRMYERIAS